MPGAAAAFGLRTRLVIAFLLVAAVSAVTTAALTYRQARNAVLVRAQDTAVTSFREEVEQFVPASPSIRTRCGGTCTTSRRAPNHIRGSSSPSTVRCAPPRATGPSPVF